LVEKCFLSCRCLQSYHQMWNWWGQFSSSLVWSVAFSKIGCSVSST
jgi:hypothetical protein